MCHFFITITLSYSLQEDEVGMLLHGVLGSLVTDLGDAWGYSSDANSKSSSSGNEDNRGSFCFTASLTRLPSTVSLPGRAPGQKQGQGQGQGQQERSFAVLNLSSDRAFWEAYVDKVHIVPWLTPSPATKTKGVGAGGGEESVSDHLGALTAPWSLEDKEEKEEDGGGSSASSSSSSASHFTVRLLERDAHSAPLLQPTLSLSLPGLLADRQALLPTLWRLPRVFCFDEFVSSLNMLEATSTEKESDTKKYPILSSFMSMFATDPAQLHALRFLPQVFEWFHRLRRHYSGHITREEARLRTHLDCLHDVASNDPGGHWAGVFTGYSQAWNASWSNVQKYGCIQFSPDFRAIQMGPDVPLTFSLPNAMDEGNCPLALTHFLVEKQNTFAQLLDEYFLLQQREHRPQQPQQLRRAGTRGGEGDATATASARRVGVVSSRFLTPAHTIRCDLHADLVPLLEKHCLLRPSSSSSGGAAAAAGGGGGKYDFAKAERLLVERFLLDVPAVDLEMPGFTFKNEQHLQGSTTALLVYAHLLCCAVLCSPCLLWLFLCVLLIVTSLVCSLMADNWMCGLVICCRWYGSSSPEIKANTPFLRDHTRYVFTVLYR